MMCEDGECTKRKGLKLGRNSVSWPENAGRPLKARIAKFRVDYSTSTQVSLTTRKRGELGISAAARALRVHSADDACKLTVCRSVVKLI